MEIKDRLPIDLILKSYASFPGFKASQEEGQAISPFYRTLSPIGATAMLPPNLIKRMQVNPGKETADHLMPLGECFSFFLVFFPFASLFRFFSPFFIFLPFNFAIQVEGNFCFR